MSNFKHGMSKTKIYGVWCAMRRRCENKNVAAYKDYGGRGIYVCERWQHFPNFYEDMGERPEGMSLERVDNDGPYSPENCKWAAPSDQTLNTRRNRYLTVDGESKTIKEWSDETDLSVGTIWARKKYGFTDEQAVKLPKMKKRAGVDPSRNLRDQFDVGVDWSERERKIVDEHGRKAA